MINFLNRSSNNEPRVTTNDVIIILLRSSSLVSLSRFGEHVFIYSDFDLLAKKHVLPTPRPSKPPLFASEYLKKKDSEAK